MEAYYSSDEEIAWGPVSMREVISDLKREPLRKPNRRHTTVCAIQNKMDSTDSSPISNVLLTLPENINKSNGSGTSTTYYSPNETFRTNNSEFLDKISQVINVPSLELSEYISVTEEPENSEKKENSKMLHVSESQPQTVDHNDTCTNFINALEKRETHYEIDKFHQTLVENSYILNDENIHKQDHSTINEECFEEQILDIQEPVILLSDTSDTSLSSSYVEEICRESVSSIRKEINLNEDKDYVENYETEYSVYQNNPANLQSEVADHEIDSVNDASYDESNDQSRDSYVVMPDVQHKLSVVKESLSTSPVIVPQIDLTQFDDSISKDDSFQLNDTVEEMNRLMNQGPNYSMSDDEVVDITPAKTEPKPEQFFTPANIRTVSSSSVNKQLFSSSNEKVSHIPKRHFGPMSADRILMNKGAVKRNSPKASFKVPETPIRSKLTLPTPPKGCPNLKNIVSPVALYIKNSPRVPLLQSVPQRELPKLSTTKTKSAANKENFPEFPQVVYTPSKNQISSTERHIVIPAYLRKLNIREGHITKHEGRIGNEMDRSKVNRKLLESDITSTSIDHSLLDNSGDISVLTNKQAFIN